VVANVASVVGGFVIKGIEYEIIYRPVSLPQVDDVDYISSAQSPV
jgi:hypothetical protein